MEFLSSMEKNGEPSTSLDQVTVDSTIRTKFLSTIFPGLICESQDDEGKVVIEMEKEKWGNGFGGDSWTSSLIKEEGIKYTFTLSEHPGIDLTIRDSEENEIFEKVYSYELEIEVIFKGEERYKELEEFNLGVSLGRRISGQKGVGFKDLRYNQEFSLEDLSVLDNREFRELLSEVSGIPKVKSLEVDYKQEDIVSTVSLKISF